VLDGNHPLAGRALIFDIEVLGVEPAGEAALAQAERAATPEFISVGAHRADIGTRH
jgi:FKBP-type peptidyl-prolyl cis-trans isomerase 2